GRSRVWGCSSPESVLGSRTAQSTQGVAGAGTAFSNNKALSHPLLERAGCCLRAISARRSGTPMSAPGVSEVLVAPSPWQSNDPAIDDAGRADRCSQPAPPDRAGVREPDLTSPVSECILTPMSTPARTLSTAEERREDVLRVAMKLVGERGLYGTPTLEVAKAAGISQAYLFRLFPTKTELFLAVLDRCFKRINNRFVEAARERRRAGDGDDGRRLYEPVAGRARTPPDAAPGPGGRRERTRGPRGPASRLPGPGRDDRARDRRLATRAPAVLCARDA